MNPLISIIVPVYNAQKTLNRCIDSIMNQTFYDWELLLIDDGSIDKSGEICDKYAELDNRVKVFHKKNEGVCVARNFGIKSSIGKYITFIDSDDKVVKNYLSVIYENIRCGADIVFFFSKWIYKDNSQVEILLDNFNSNEQNAIEKEIALLMNNKTGHDLLGFTWNKIFKSSIIKEHHLGFIENLVISEDEIFTLDYCRYVKQLKVIPFSLYIYYKNEVGLTYKKKEPSEWILLADCYNHLMNEYVYEGIKICLNRKVKICLLNAINNCDLSLISKFYVIFHFIRKFCKKNHLSMPYKSILRVLVLKR